MEVEMDETGRWAITTWLVKRLIDVQFPQWSHLAIKPVLPGGWDNRTFRLGDSMLVRLPSAERYVAQVEKEQRWLPFLAKHLPVSIPEPLAMGHASEQFPSVWSVYAWLPGTTANEMQFGDHSAFALQLAEFLLALQKVPVDGAPSPGAHNFFRGDSPRVYDGETLSALEKLRSQVDVKACLAVWSAAAASDWTRPPVWIHGDVAPGNLLTSDAKLSAVIDFGSSAVGDPACDFTMAWSYFSADARASFRAALQPDEGTWNRACGWALWKALITWATVDKDTQSAMSAQRTITELLSDFEAQC